MPSRRKLDRDRINDPLTSMFYIEHRWRRGATFDLDGDATNRPFKRSIEVFGARFGETFRGSPLLPVALPALRCFLSGLRTFDLRLRFPQLFAVFALRVSAIR